jgi:CheY-like chemotaxis protein
VGQKISVEQNRKSAQTNLNGRKILLVEDHPLNVELAKRLLEKNGMKVEIARNGVESVEQFEGSQTGYYDAVLMDIHMPVMDGLQAAKKIRSMLRPDSRQVPIIAMTANAYEEDRENTKKAGMNAHLAKPIQPELLYGTLAREIGRYRN